MITVHENTMGTVAKCDCCNKYTLRIGTLMLGATVRQLEDLLIAFKESYSQNFSYETCKEKLRINFALNQAHLSLSLCKKELLESIELLDLSIWMIKVENLVYKN